ncbi:MAG TPA: hypothetical protein PLW48_03325 [Alphaproteobacteria bacterium]|nr:hypothetical protein [Rhodospirillaceae bacterium]HRJ66141.1 hypothetical protein [Alphaproteobacteria bacterium]
MHRQPFYMAASPLTVIALVFILLFFPATAAHAGCNLASNGAYSLFKSVLCFFIVWYVVSCAQSFMKTRSLTTKDSNASLSRFHFFAATAVLAASFLPSFFPLAHLLDGHYPKGWPDYSRAHDQKEFENRLALDFAALTSLLAIAFLFKKRRALTIKTAAYVPLAFLFTFSLYGGHTAFFIKRAYYALNMPCCQIQTGLLTHTGGCPPSLYSFKLCRKCT